MTKRQGQKAQVSVTILARTKRRMLRMLHTFRDRNARHRQAKETRR